MRSFIAINLPDTVKTNLGAIIGRLRPTVPPAKWVAPSNLHLTLKFLDEISEDQIGPLTQAIQRGLAKHPAINFRIGGFGAFPSDRRARVFWVGISEGADALVTLAASIDKEVVKLGFTPEERPFSAHITLARLREPAPLVGMLGVASATGYNSPPISVAQVDLMQSSLTPSGSVYSVLDSVSMKV